MPHPPVTLPDTSVPGPKGRLGLYSGRRRSGSGPALGPILDSLILDLQGVLILHWIGCNHEYNCRLVLGQLDSRIQFL